MTNRPTPLLGSLAMIMGFASACGPPPDEGVTDPQALAQAASTTTCKAVTLSGDLYYNDQRTYGRFPIHRTPSGDGGRQYKLLDAETGGAGTHTANFLSLIDASVEIYEIDRVTAGHPSCLPEVRVATVTTDADGHFSWSGTVCDPCPIDDAPYELSDAGKVGVSLAAKIVLRYCPDSTSRCFSVKEPIVTTSGAFDEHDLGAVQYALWHSAASLLTPRRVFQDGAAIALDDGYFQAEGGGYDDKYLQAAYAFEGLAEVTRKLHVTLGIPFRRSTFGEVTAIYPMKWPNHGAGHSHERLGADNANSLCLPAPGTESTSGSVSTTWSSGSTVFHEYGHLVNYRAWSGYGKYVDYNYSGCIDDNGDCTGEYDNEEFASAAFKEPWANFIKRVALNELVPTVDTLDYAGCAFWDGEHSARSWDNDDDAAVTICNEPVACTLGDRSPGAVEHALCDLFDDHIDAPEPLTFKGSDTVGDETLSGIITDLERTWSDAAQWRRDAYLDASDGGDKVMTGLGICELAARRVARVPADRTAVDNLMKKNGIDCGL